MACTWTQVSYWRDSMTLWQHAVKITNGAYRAHNNLGVLLWEKGNGDEARREIAKCKVYGGTPNPRVLSELENRMPEPKGRPGR